MPKEQFDQASLSQPEMAMHSPPCQTMQQGDGLRGEQVFQFVGGHCWKGERDKEITEEQ
jgi:hypothetical protein